MNAIPKTYLWAGAAALVALFVLTRKGVAGSLAANLVQGAVETAGDAATGAVIGLGKAVGIPATDADVCTLAIVNGDAWEASKVCPAPRFLSWAMGKPDFEAEKTKFIRQEGGT